MEVASVNPDEHIVKTELFDANIMEALLNQTDTFSKSDLNKLAKYKRNRKHGNQVEVVYHYSKGFEDIKIGRVYARGGLGLQSFPFDIRNPLLEKYYWDIDMENCHYVILNQLAEQWNVKHEKINYYVNNRDYCLKLISDDRSVAKTVYLKVAYGGNIKLYNESYDDQGIPVNADLSVIMGIEKEIEPIINLCWMKYPQYHCKVKKRPNPKLSLYALILQDEERKCLFAMDEYMKSQNRQVDILIHDGGEVRKLPSETEFPEKLLNEAEKYITLKTGYYHRLVNKPFRHSFKHVIENTKTEFEQNHFKLMNPDRYVRIYKGELQLLSKDAIVNLYINYNRGFVKSWILDPEIKTYEKLGFYPKQCPESEYNLFNGFAVEKLEYESDYDIKTILNQIMLLCGNDIATYEYLLNYIADIFQNPEQKPGVCIIMNGDQGTGKDTLWDFIGSLIGRNYYLTTGRAEEDVFGRFNFKTSQKLLIKMEETSVKILAKNKETLKTIITSPIGNYEQKGQPTITMNSYERYVITTNDDVPIYLESTDRRYCIITTSNERIGDREYFEELINCYENPYIQRAFYEFLINRDLGNFNIKNRPITEAYNYVKIASSPYHAKFFQHFTLNYNEAEYQKLEPTELYEMIKRFHPNFTISLNGFARNMRDYIDNNCIEYKRIKSNRVYSLNFDKIQEFLRRKGWWVDF
jgi:hypothetical protein